MTHSRTGRLRAVVVLLFLLGGTLLGRGATAYSKADRVNVRSRPGFVGEIVTQLAKGQAVTVLETVSLRKPATDEPPVWLKIELPQETPVWANAEYVERTSGKVTADLLNVRSGPTYDHAILARAKKGATVKVLSPEPTTNGWIRIAAPAGAIGFVPASWFVTSPEAVAAANPKPPATPPAAPRASATTAVAGKGTNTPPVAAAPTRASVPTEAAASKPSTNAMPSSGAVAAVPGTPRPTIAERDPKRTSSGPGAAVPPTVASTSSTSTNNAWLEQFVAPPTSTQAPTSSVPSTVAAPSRPVEPARAVEATGASESGAPPVVPPVAESETTDRRSADSDPDGGSAEDGPPKRRWSTPAPSPKAEATVRRYADPSGRAAIVPGTPGRWVRREGIVIRPSNITAPSFYALKSRDGGRVIDFLVASGSSGDVFREYRGRVVIVTGREYRDRRSAWRDTPLLDVETLEAVR
ncbi:MAG: SH3 domain-containing protein [Verrucomicrobiales bacterium]|nr:SH3 domain-containing protein [Verrucomicrobiales bacterium]